MDSVWNLVEGETSFSSNEIAQPQLPGMFPTASQANEVRKYTTDDWDAQRLEITRLWENYYTLKSVINLMIERHGLHATNESATLLAH
jgi:hypothetical protein